MNSRMFSVWPARVPLLENGGGTALPTGLWVPLEHWWRAPGNPGLGVVAANWFAASDKDRHDDDTEHWHLAQAAHA